MTEKEVLHAIQLAYEKASNRKKAEGMSAYMRDQFVFLGISAPDRSELLKPILSAYQPSKHGYEWLIQQLWDMEAREYHYAAMGIASKYQSMWQEQSIHLFELLLTKHSWWDTVDSLCSQTIGPFFQKFEVIKLKTLPIWEKSPNMWLNRACIIHQLHYKHKTDTQYLQHVIQMHAESNEFFIQKAIGWSLRQYAKTNPQWVVKLVNDNTLKPLSKREALKHIK